MTAKRPVFFMPFLMPGRKDDWQKFFKKKKDVAIGVGTISKKGFRLTLQTGESKQLYAFTDGVLLALKKNERLQDGVFDYTAGSPAIVIKTMPGGKLAKASKALSMPNYIVYENVDLQQLKSDLLKAGGPIRRYVSKAVYQALVGKAIKAGKKTDLLEKLNQDYATKLIPDTTATRKQFYTVPVRCGEVIGQMKNFLDFRLAEVIPGSAVSLKKISYLDVQNVLNGTAHYDHRLKNHPLLSALSSFSGPAEFYLRFDIWDEVTKKASIFSTEVQMVVNVSPGSPVIYGGTAEPKSGVVRFQLAKALVDSYRGKEIYFTAGKGAETFKTQGLNDRNGVPGWFVKYPGMSLGSKSNPLVFHVKIVKSIELMYLDHKKSKSGARALVPFPPGVLVSLEEKMPGGEKRSQTMRTDAKGALRFPFSNTGQFSMEIVVSGNVHSSKEALTETEVFRTTRARRNTNDKPPMEKLKETFKSNVSIFRLPGTRLVVARSNRYYNAALYAIKTYWEVHRWLRLMTRNEWKGMPFRIVLYESASAGKQASFARYSTRTSASAGHYQAHIDLSDQWDRFSLVHEIGHCVSYQALNVYLNNFSTYFPGNKGRSHNLDVISNHNTAFVEGWPEFMAQVFGASRYQGIGKLKKMFKSNALTYIEEFQSRPPTNWSHRKWGKSPYLLSCRRKKAGVCVRYRHHNLGDLVEGAFAGALLNVYQFLCQATGSSVGTGYYVSETVNGDLFASTKFFRDRKQDNYPMKDFQELVWGAFKVLRRYSVRTDNEALSAKRFLEAICTIAEMSPDPGKGAAYAKMLRGLMNEFNTVVK